MKLIKVVELMEKYENCHRCGSGSIGNGRGSLEVTDDAFIRSCKCGWRIEIKDGEGE